MNKIISFFVLITLLIGILSSVCSCSIYKDDFYLYSCGSAITFNRSETDIYRIKELDLEFKGNYVYLDDYFYSESLGEKYIIKNSLVPVGEVYLAKKSDYYDNTVHTIDIDHYDNDVVVITPDMFYVHILSSSGQEKELHISVESRELPVDITFENVNIHTKSAIPVFFSGSHADINIKLIGHNSFTAGSIRQRSESLSDKLANGLTKMEDYFNDSYEIAIDTIQEVPDYIMENGIFDILNDALKSVGNASADIFESALNGYVDVVIGKDGKPGKEGTACFFHFGGISFSGEGKIEIIGGEGGKGHDAKDSLAGMADGGQGGNGGAGVSCGKFLDYNNISSVIGGNGGEGGEPSDSMFGLLGSSGEKGKDGNVGTAKIIAEKYDTKKK